MKKLILTWGLLLLIPVAARPDDPSRGPMSWNQAFGKRGFVEFSILGDTHRGDLDGKLVLGTSEKVFYIPKVRAGFGFKLGYGQTWKSGMWSIGFARTVHNASYQGIMTTASTNAFEVSGKGYLLTKTRILPYLELGFGLPWIHVTGGAERGGVGYNSNYLGLFIRAGGGLLIPVGRKAFLTLGTSYHFMFGMYAKGPGRGRDVTNLYVDRFGPRRDIFLKIPGMRVEIGFAYLLR
jgi:hypothetical protein